MDAVSQLAPTVGVESACDVLGVSRASFYRQRPLLGPMLAAPTVAPSVRPTPARALSEDERKAVRAVLNSERFQDCSPAAIQATLLDEGQYLCSTRTMYRVLRRDGATRERRDQLTHPPYQKPELLATGPNQLWSWDITKLRGPVKWTYFYLYVILDVFSRFVVGWMVAPREGAELARKLIQETCEKQNILPDQLSLHADRGSAMRSKPVALLLADLSVTKTHSRPYTSNDNPFSESQFRTMKYRPEFPDRFGCIQDSRAFCQTFFPWYNHEHRHSGIGMMTPAMDPLRPGHRHSPKPPTGSRRRLPGPPRSLRPPTAHSPKPSKGGLDQQTTKLRRQYSLNSISECLKVVDTRRDGNSGRNILDGPGMRNIDLALFRDFSIRESIRLQVRAEMTNAFNLVNLNNPNAALNSPAVGTIRSARDMRETQLGLRLTF